ncbi:MAG TPA: AAA family ATPase [Gammaproteobacteria bacterium]
MYCDLFNLTEPPFRLSPDPQFLFASKQHARAKAYMESSVWLSDGFVVLTGEIGCGKTTLIESFIESLPKDVVLAHISQTQLTPVEFLQAVLVELGIRPFGMRKVELLTMLKAFLLEQYSAGRRVLFVVDEAQNLTPKVLEEIRLLGGIESHKEKVLRIILAGQPELGSTLDSPEMEQLSQRVRLRFHLAALSKRETLEYVSHRLKIAGAGSNEIFDEQARRLIFRYTGGIPRLINVLCDSAMLCAFADEKNVVTKAELLDAVEELQWVPYAERLRERKRALERLHDTASVPVARLEVLENDETVDEIDLVPGRIIIGRAPGADLTISSKVVSRHHAQIVTDLQQSQLEDLNSTNGVYVDSRRIRLHKLADGEHITMGRHELVYRDLRGRAFISETTGDEAEDAGERTEEAS